MDNVICTRHNSNLSTLCCYILVNSKVRPSNVISNRSTSFVPCGDIWRIGKVISVDEHSFEVGLLTFQHPQKPSNEGEDNSSFCDNFEKYQEEGSTRYSWNSLSVDVFLCEESTDPPETTEDLCDLKYLHCPSVLHCLQRRFHLKKCFTSASDVIISINPYEESYLHTTEIQNSYRGLFRKNRNQAHIYSISQRSFEHLVCNQTNQSIIVSGESGAGKTETVKHLINHIVVISDSEQLGAIKQIVSANLVLELFGNAQTEKNTNSSRYGKLIKIHISDATHGICGCTIETYLLEKFRTISCSSPRETNFHIFYQIFDFEDYTKEQLYLGGKCPSEFQYTKHRHVPSEHDLSGKDILHFLQDGLQLQYEEVFVVLQVISGLLYLGEWNIHGSNQCLHTAALLLGVEFQLLTEYLCRRDIQLERESISTELSLSQQLSKRDATVTQIYYELFQWIVERINRCSSKHSDPENLVDSRTIALLDIFGFEILQNNFLEQLLINFANEKLHIQFLNSTIINIQEEYRQEGIPYFNFDFQKVEETINQLERKLGLFDLLHEQCLVPGGSDNNFASSLNFRMSKFETLKMSKCSRKFTVVHFAGTVHYEINGIIERNRDSQVQGLNKLMMQSKNSVLFEAANYRSKILQPGSVTNNSFICPGTIAKKFTNQVNTLIEQIQSTELHFIKCIKPNTQRLPKLFDEHLVLEQLRCTGVIEAANTMRSDYQYKVKLQEFQEKYHCLALKQHHSLGTVSPYQFPNVLLKLFPLLNDNDSSFQIGSTKLFATQAWISKVDKLKYILEFESSTKIQSTLKMFLNKQKYRNMKICIQKLQRAGRIYLSRKWLLNCKVASTQIQKLVRMYLAKKNVKSALRRQLRFRMGIHILENTFRLNSLNYGFKFLLKKNSLWKESNDNYRVEDISESLYRTDYLNITPKELKTNSGGNSDMSNTVAFQYFCFSLLIMIISIVQGSIVQ